MTTVNLHNIDCLDYMSKMDDNSVDVIITDIPYHYINRPSSGLRNLTKGDADVLTFDLKEFVSECIRVTKKSIYIFCAHQQTFEIYSELINRKGSIRFCTWEKTDPSPMNGQHIWLSSTECCVFFKRPGAEFHEHCSSSVWREGTERHIKNHTTPKPVLLLRRLILASSSIGDTIFDPCMGSGTTGIACRLTDRNFIGLDINNEYVTLARQNIESLDLNSNPWSKKLEKRKTK